MANHFVRSEFPQQVSTDQASQDRSEIAFSNGASFTSFSTVDGYLLNSEHHVVRNGILDVTGQQQLAYTHSVETSAGTRRPRRPARHPEYIDYSQRLRSYARWIRLSPGPVCLCEAGFFFTDQGDLVRCFQCGIGLKDFSSGDDPLLEHVRHSGDCPYLVEHLGTAGLSAIKTKCQAEQAESNEQQRSSVHCRHPQYQTYEARVSSFTSWPNYLTQKPEELAEAGLFYTGVEDHVRCFTCDGGLRHWDAEDDSWTEHCRWFPSCQYAREKKGDEFIALVQASTEYNAEEPENLSNEGTGSQGLVGGAIEQMTLRDPALKAVLDEHKNVCLEMGYDLADFNAAVKDLRNMGTIRPTLDEILDMVEVVQERKQSQQRAAELEQRHETPLEENLRLKSFVICMSCGKNNVNALFIPCTHHRVCMECAEPLTQCPVCGRNIRQKIRTFLV
ncbi:baculoviral IAP repeat-containing protein 8-like [Mercenaria mercenaria]|uniref:baculoviral IAP repeat-containing protein 8-like n=1 Tax=Mercenaria mercenaria TaxID=6596 RepID=UPI00234EBF33|nr:baculoviral IAP repeat-containing protein 8-like [Mercenaria mercenaria]XP_045195749.2 baculoviral IAP repeat-containing protein 8-like [Mercenaria mercenaria]